MDTIVRKLRRLSVSRLQAILEFVNFLDWQESQVGTDTRDTLTNDSESARQADWRAFIQECTGAFPDFPTIGEIRSDVGEEITRE